VITLLFCLVAGGGLFSTVGAAPPAAQAATDPEAGSNIGKYVTTAGISFPVNGTIEGSGSSSPAVLTGTGIRTKFFFKIYAGAHYIEEGLTPPDDPYDWLVKGQFRKKCIMHFLMGIPRDRMRNEFKTNIEKNLTEKELAEVESEFNRLLSFFSEDAARGSEIIVSWVPDTGMIVYADDHYLGTVKSELMMEAVWSFWFGPKPISGKLKRDMARELVSK